MKEFFLKDILKIAKQVYKGLLKSLKKFLTLENWPYWGSALLIILIIVLVIFFIRKRRKAAKSEPGSIEGKQEQEKKAIPKEPALPLSSLTDIWKKFLKGIPPEFRRSIMLYEPFIVMGESGSGKSALIDNYTDWQGQSRQFYPSYTADPLLQFYLGSRIIVQEMPSALLNDTSKSARAALLKLWNSVFKKKPPKVVIVLNGSNIASESPESLKKQAQMMRGKINLLSRKRKKNVKVCIALTHMNYIEGFTEFFNFLSANQIPLKIEVNEQEDLEQLADCLEPYESYLAQALTSLPAKDYLKIISFFRKAPGIFSTLAEFIRIFQGPDPLSAKPEIFHLSLASHMEKDASVSNPFKSTLSHDDIKKFNPILKHQVAAALLLLAGLFYLGFGYIYEYNLLKENDKKLKAIENAPPLMYNDEMHKLFVDFSISSEDGSFTDAKKDPLLLILPDFFPNSSQDIRERLLQNIRETYLLPQLKDLREDTMESDSYEKSIWLLALIYSSNSNELGKLVKENAETWASNLGYPRILINDYIKHSNVSWDQKVDAGYLAKRKAIEKPHDMQPWLFFMNELELSLKKSFITKAYLKDMQEKAKELLNIQKESDRRDLSVNITRLLKEEAFLDIKSDWKGMVMEAQLRQDSIIELLEFFLLKKISYPDADALNFSRLIANIKAMMVNDKEEKGAFSFYMTGKEYSFNPKKIDKLMKRSSITLFIRSFMKQNKWNDGTLFFGIDSDFPDIVLNANNDGTLFFTGTAKIDGRFTKKAFKEEIKPILSGLPKFLITIPIRRDERTRFSNFIIKGVKAYAKRYIYEYRHYYNAFGITAEFPGALQYVLNQIQMPSSQFQEVLFKIKENTSIEIEDNSFLRPFKLKLREFDFFSRLLREDKGAYPEFEKYIFILADMQSEIEANKPYTPENEEDESNALKTRLSPLGRICLSVFRNEENSYLTMINMWLNSMGTPPEWQRLFLAPVLEAYSLGQAEVEGLVAKVWKKVWDTEIRPSLAMFPFDMRAETTIEPAWLNANLHPQGKFWKIFNSLAAPVCQKKENTWQPRESSRGTMALPENMLKNVNEMEYLKGLLWDEKEAPKPLKFKIKPHMLPLTDTDGAMPVLSFLHSGKASVFGFNQQAAWTDFDLEWWNRHASSVGIELAKPDLPQKAYRRISVQKSDWSFYRILRKAGAVDEQAVEWVLADSKNKTLPVPVQFSIKPDPWKVFRPEKAFKDPDKDNAILNSVLE